MSALKLTSQELLAFLQQHASLDYPIEVNLTNPPFNCTHYMYWGGTTLADIGIDEKLIHWKPEEFVAAYPRSVWRIREKTLQAIVIQ